MVCNLRRWSQFNPAYSNGRMMMMKRFLCALLIAVALPAGAAGVVQQLLVQPGGGVARSYSSKLAEFISVTDYGAIAGDPVDDTAAIQKAVDAAVAAGKRLIFPGVGSGGEYRVSSPIVIGGQLAIVGDNAAILALGTDVFQITSQNYVSIQSLKIAQAVRYTTTPNSYAAIRVTGATGARNYWHIYRDLFIDGFETAIHADWIWASVFDSIQTVYGNNGIVSGGLSVNNAVSNSGFSGTEDNATGGTGIKIGDGVTATEGWMIKNTLVFGFKYGIRGLAASNVYIDNSIIDYFTEVGVLVQSAGGNIASMWTIRGSYLASDAAGSTGIYLLNSVASAQNRGNVIADNLILSYTPGRLTYGVLIEGTEEDHNIVVGNRVKADGGTYDAWVKFGSRSVIANNTWLGNGFYTDISVLYQNNAGTVISSSANLRQSNGANAFYYGSAAPVSGTYNAGDIVWNTAASAGGKIGWIATAGGTPGTWKAFGAIDP